MSLEKITIHPESTVKEAIKKLDRGGERTLFVINKKGILIGIMTDSDIRRYILKSGDLNLPIKHCYNKNPLVLSAGFDLEYAKKLMINESKEIIPIIDEQGRLVEYLTWSHAFGETQRKAAHLDIPVIIMAGGRGTRLDPFTQILPKPLIPVGDKPIVEIIMDNFHEYGIEDFYLIVNYKGEMIKSYFDHSKVPYNINYIWEKEFLGTCGSLAQIPRKIKGTFIVSNCDILVKTDYTDMVAFHKNNGHALTVVGSLQHYRIPYGVLEYKKGGNLKAINEKPEFDMMVNTGLYVLETSTLAYIPKGREFNMNELITLLLAEKCSVGVYPVSENAYADIGQWEEYKKTLKKFAID